MIKWRPLKIIDKYIIKQFIGIYLFSIILIVAIVVIFDFNEKLDKFMQNSVPNSAIIFDYYFNFIPYFANLFSPLFVFISVIFFTSKLSDHSEIIAFLSSGVSFKRFMFPYLLSASLIAFITFLLNSYIIPLANVKRIQFSNLYIRNDRVTHSDNIQLEVSPGIIAYFDSFDSHIKTGYCFSLEKFKENKLCSRMTAEQIVWNSKEQWTVKNYVIYCFSDLREVTFGESLDTMLNIRPSDFMISVNDCEQMTTPHLKAYIDREKKRGIDNIQPFELEYYKRHATAFAAFILTIIGISLSSRKIKGGMGMNIGLGLFLSFSYILFVQISSSFAILGLVSPFIAVWIPNGIYLAIAVFLYKKVLQ